MHGVVVVSCSRCQAPSPTVHITAKAGNAYLEMHFCVTCAPTSGEVIVHLPIGMIRCPRCGTSALDIQTRGRFGCSDDYSIFASAISPGLEKYHGSSKHVGKNPSIAKLSA